MTSRPLAGPGFRFSNQRERDIYGRLRLIGDGPAANFMDACRLMADDDGLGLQSATHVVGHLLREIESAVRDVLVAFATRDGGVGSAANTERPDGAAEAEPTGQVNHKEEIRSVLRYFRLEEISRIGQLWLALVGAAKGESLYIRPLQAIAHRNALARPRPLDGKFRLFWGDVLELLDGLLSRFESSYAVAIEIVDELLALERPTRKEAQRLRDAVPNSRVVLGYFFDRCQNPLWISMLAAQGVFAYPPGADVDEETGAAIGYPIWPASRYLARMARLPHAQAEVARVVRELMPTDNPHVREDIVEMLTQLPVDWIADLVPDVSAWIESEEA